MKKDVNDRRSVSSVGIGENGDTSTEINFDTDDDFKTKQLSDKKMSKQVKV